MRVRKLAGWVALGALMAVLPAESAHAGIGGACRKAGVYRTIPQHEVCAPAWGGRLRWLPVRVVNWYGDSLTWEAQRYATAQSDPTLQLLVQGLGGTAPCDVLEAVGREYERDHPDVVVLQFSGNAIFPCMRDSSGEPLGGTALLEGYRRDLTQLIAQVPDATVVLVGAPVPRSSVAAEEPTNVELVNGLMRQLALDTGIQFVDAGEVVLDADGNYADVLPCLFFEPCSGLDTGTELGGNKVRSWDGVHFCPTVTQAIDGVVDPCPVYSSGAMRYAAAILEAIDEALAERDAVSPS